MCEVIEVNRTVLVGLLGGVLLLVALLWNWQINRAPEEETGSAPSEQEEAAESAASPDAGDATEPAQSPASEQQGETDAVNAEAASEPDVSSEPKDTASKTPEAEESDTDTPDDKSDTSEPSAESEETAAASPPAAATEQEAAPSSQTTQDSEDAPPDSDSPATAEAPDDDVTASKAQETETPSAPAPPSFDVVRIDPKGDTVIAGRAAPDSVVTILDGDSVLGEIEADGRGEWVFLPDHPLEPGSHRLSLRAILPDGGEQTSENDVVLVVPERGQTVAGNETADGETGDAMALLVPKEEDKPGAKVLQKPNAPAENKSVSDSVQSETGDLAVDSVDYTEEGAMSIGGRGVPGTEVRAYLDNKLIGRGTVLEDGIWRIDPDETIDAGVYTLRLDQVAQGDVIARLELPFARAEPMTDFKGDAFVIVQPGNSLWRIARRTLGSGFNYTVIYQANEDQIRNPDLIYPGQVFEVPAN